MKYGKRSGEDGIGVWDADDPEDNGAVDASRGGRGWEVGSRSPDDPLLAIPSRPCLGGPHSAQRAGTQLEIAGLELKEKVIKHCTGLVRGWL